MEFLGSMAPGTFGMRLLLLAPKRAAMSLAPPDPLPKSAAAFVLLEGIIKLFPLGQTIGLAACVTQGKLGSCCLIGEIEVGDAFGHKLS